MLQDNADDRHTENFLKEINMMKDIGYHRNIVSILGCCTLRQPYCLVVEHMPHGDLLAYFRNIRQKLQEQVDNGDGYINQDADMFSPRDLLSVARQITAGMEFLSQKGFVHRDLAARNVLVGDNKAVKIGDFGLARYIYHDTNKIYVTRRGGKLPLRWMSPEAIFSMTFSTASDIWSFGILLYEIVTLGGAPYSTLSNTELLQALKHGHRMARPDNCSQEIYNIMLDCWNEVPEARPSFTNLCRVFTGMLEEDTYLEYFTFNVPLEHDYYGINSDTMDDDCIDLDDQGFPTGSGIHTCHVYSRPTVSETAGPSHSQMVATEIRDKDCSAVDITKSDVASADYTDNVFRIRHRASVSSFDNELYSSMDKNLERDQHTTNSVHCKEKAEISVKSLSHPGVITHHLTSETEDVLEGADELPKRLTRPDEDRTSASSDEVFTSCPSCARMTTDKKFDTTEVPCTKKLNTVMDDSDMTECPDCGRIDISLTPFDIHVSQRNDSAICSTASDDSDQSQSNQSESSMAISDVYLMPDSPFTTSAAADDAGYCSNTKAMNTFNFVLLDVASQFKRTRGHDISSDLKGSINCVGISGSQMLQEKRSMDQVLLEQSHSENDIWFICQTKF